MTRLPRVPLFRRGVLALLGAGLMTAGCAPKIYAERTPGFDLESAKTYAWFTEELVLIQFGADQPNIRTKDNEIRLRTAIDRELASRGFTKVSREQADVMVAFSVGVQVRYRIEGGNGTAVTTDGPGATQTKGTLHIYLIDPANEEEVWHGWTSRWLPRGADADEVVNQSVANVMSNYPGTAP